MRNMSDEMKSVAVVLAVIFGVAIYVTVLVTVRAGTWVGMMGRWAARYGVRYIPRMGSGMMGFGWRLSFITTLVIIAVIGMVAYLLISGRRQSGAHATSGGTGALEILKERYARGEISEEQYRKMRDDIAT
jgi:putative membrane protein